MKAKSHPFYFDENRFIFPRSCLPQRHTFHAIVLFLFCVTFIHALLLDAFPKKQRAFHASRSSFNVYHSSHFYDTSTLMLIFGLIADDPRNSLHFSVKKRWQCNILHGSMIMHECVALGSLTFHLDLLVEKRTLITEAFCKCRRTAAYRLRRKRGRIKTQFERRKPGVSEQRSVGFADKKMTPPTPDSYKLPKASAHRVYSALPHSPLQTATSGSRRRRTNQGASKGVNSLVTTISRQFGQRGTKGRER